MIKLDLINEVVTKTGVTKTKAEMAVETVFESMKKSLARGDRIELRGFGVFTVRPRKTGIGRNPRTGTEVNIPPGKAGAKDAARAQAIGRWPKQADRFKLVKDDGKAEAALIAIAGILRFSDTVVPYSKYLGVVQNGAGNTSAA